MNATLSSERIFRPWNTDSIGVVLKDSPAAVTISYEHDRSKSYTIPRNELNKIGRFVRRDAF